MNKIEFHLMQSRKKRLFGYDPGGSTATDPNVPLPVIGSFTASPASITTLADSSSTLSWSVTGASVLRIDQGVGEVTGLSGKVVKPSASTIYTLTASNSSGSTTKKVTVTVEGTTTPTNPDRPLYWADPNFDPAVRYDNNLSRDLAEALFGALASASTTEPRLEAASSVYSDLSPNHVDMYRVRKPKIMFNVMRGILSHKPDPRAVRTLFPFVKVILDGLTYNWITWNNDIMPGEANSSGRVLDPYSADGPSSYGAGDGEIRWNGGTKTATSEGNGILDNGGSRAEKGAYKRSKAWNSSTNRGSPDYRSLKDTHELPQYKKLLYLSEGNEAGRMNHYGTHLHILDNLLAHACLFWACYILEANEHLDEQFGIYGRLGYDYCFNHWGPLVEKMMAPRHSTLKFFKFRKGLHHNVAAHTSIYDCRIHWKKLRNETPLADDVTALKSMMKMQLDQFFDYGMPSGLYEGSSNDFFSNYGHANEEYSDYVGLNTQGIGDTTYDQEFGGELYNLYRTGAKDSSGRVFTKEHFARLCKTYAFICYPKQITGTSFNVQVAEHVSANTSPTSTYKKVHFNDGNKMVDGAWNGSEVSVRWGGKTPNYTNHPSTATGMVYMGFLGGWYMFADDTPELRATRNWMRRAKNNAGSQYRVIPDDLLGNPTNSKRKAWHWVSAYLLCKLENPGRTLTGLDLSW